MNGTQGFKNLFKHLKLLKEYKRITITNHTPWNISGHRTVSL